MSVTGQLQKEYEKGVNNRLSVTKESNMDSMSVGC